MGEKKLTKKQRETIEKERVLNIVNVLEDEYGEALCSLEHRSPLELLIATQLAAQCTDARVNTVTPALFDKYKSADDFAAADIDELMELIKSTGFFRNKAKNIINCCKKLVENFDSKVPREMEELLTLDGVGRKTANVVLGAAFDTPGIIVDTHMKRIANRLGLTKNTDPVKIEYDLIDVIPKNKWTSFSHAVVFHGRAACKARKPLCGECRLGGYCPGKVN